MVSKVTIDDELLRQAVAIGGLKTKRETVNKALQEFVERRQRREIVKLFGTIDYDPRYDYKRDRRGR